MVPGRYALNMDVVQRSNSITQFNNNLQQTNALLATADCSIEDTADALSEVRRFLVAAMNSSDDSDGLATTQQEIYQLVLRINENAKATYNGELLFDGTRYVAARQLDGYENLPLGDISAYGLGLTDWSGYVTIGTASRSAIADSFYIVGQALSQVLDQRAGINMIRQGLSPKSINYFAGEEKSPESLALEALNYRLGDDLIRKRRLAIKELVVFVISEKKPLYNHNNAAAVTLLI